MDERQQNYQDDALIMISIRNAFYKRKYYFALGIYLLSLVVIVLLLNVLYYLVKKPTEPIYFAADKVGRLIPDIPLTSPNMTADNVADWVVEAVTAAYTYDYLNYHDQLQSAQIYFTDYGWHKYMDGLTASNNLIALTSRKLVQVAQVIGKPKLIAQGLLDNAVYAWKFEAQLLVIYLQPPYDEKSRFENPLTLTVTVSRQKVLASYKGLGVVQMIATLVSAPPQNLNPTQS